MLGDRDYMRGGGASSAFSTHWQEKSIVNRIIIINVVIFLLQFLTKGVQTDYTRFSLGYSDAGLTSYLWLSVPTIKEFWRFGTYMFVHSTTNILHIFINMWMLYLFGKPVEQRIGGYSFLKLYILSGVLGAICWLLFNLNSNVPVIGASGAVFGVMAAAALLFPRMKLLLIFPPIVMTVKTLVICLAILDIIMLYRAHSNIAHLAHLGGLLGGYLFIKFFITSPSSKPSKKQNPSPTFQTIMEQVKNKFPPKSNYKPNLHVVDDVEDEIDDEELISSRVDPILDKIGKHGMQSLTVKEKKILEKARNKLKDR